MATPMKAQILSRLVFAAALSFPGPVAARLLAAVAPDPTPTPAATSPSDPAPGAAADARPPVQVSAPPSAPAPAGAAASPGAAAPGSAPQALTQLSKKDAAARLKALPEEDRKWLEDYVAPIIMPDERNLFLQLTEPHQRETFKEEFWKRRELPGLPEPLGPGYRNRYESLREAAETTYGGLKSDTGKMVVLHGEPLNIQEFPNCNNVFRDIAIWTYRKPNPSGSALRSEIQYLFYRTTWGSGFWQLWLPTMPENILLGPAACVRTIAETCRPQGTSVPNSPDTFCPKNATQPTCDDACNVARIVQNIKSEGPGVATAGISEPPKVDTEGLEKLAGRFPTVGDANAKPLSIQGPGSETAVVPSSPNARATDQTAVAAPAPTHRKLSKKEARQLEEALPPQYKDFLILTEMIITPEEKEVFLQINENYQRDKFIDAFWKRRTIDSAGIRTNFRAVYTRRVQQAIEQFGDVHNDRSKIFVMAGPPDAVIPVDCQEVYVPLQIWYYERLEALKSKAYLIFYEPYSMPPYKLWLPIDGRGVLLVGVGSQTTGARPVDVQRCFEWRSVDQAIQYTTALLGGGAFGLQALSKIIEPPKVETEGVDTILTMTTDLHQGASDIGVKKLVRFPEMRGNKMGVDLSLLVPKAELHPRSLGEEGFYNIDVIGEVVKDDRLIDNFKYRFDIPVGEIGGEKIPLTVRRYIYPGEYKLVLKVSDGNQNAEGRLSETFVVPEQPDAPPPEVVAARAAGKAAVGKMKDEGLLPSAVTIQPIAKEIVTGLQRFETRVAEGVKAVDFFLNGSKVMTRTKAPYDADLNLGPLPRKQTIRVVAYGPTGRTVGEDEYIVNEGKEIFKIRILTPEKGSKVTGPTKVVAAVAVPEGKALQKLEFYSNEARVATLYQAPYEQTVNIKDSKSLGYVRVVGTLDDGTVAEDLRYVNAPQFVSEVTVDAVELYTTVTEKGRPVNYLQASNFKVMEDGVIQKIEGFEYVKNLPLSLGIMIDTSASMLESLPEAEQAALKFIDFSIGEKDRAFVISFDNEPYLLSKLTSRRDKLVRSLSGLRAEGSTALYDAIIYGLYQFTGIKGKKALVLLTDGKDTASKFDFDTLAEYVKKSGIAIYAIGLKISGTDLEVKYKLNKIAQVTGGQTFYIDSIKNLEAVYRQINEELRSQYLLTYYSSNNQEKERWRKVEVKVEPTNLQARTISGYYP
jgi:Ca-activated chloride channel family protein